MQIHTSSVTEVTPDQTQQPGCIDNSTNHDSVSQSVNELMSDKGVCRTAPATPGLLITQHLDFLPNSGITADRRDILEMNRFLDNCEFVVLNLERLVLQHPLETFWSRLAAYRI